MQKIISFHQFILEIQSILEAHDQTDYTNFWTCPPQNFFINFVSTCKRSGYLINLFWRYFWLIKKSCSLIDWEHFGPYLRNKNFPKYRICAEDGQTLFHRTFRLPLGIQLATFFGTLTSRKVLTFLTSSNQSWMYFLSTTNTFM